MANRYKKEDPSLSKEIMCEDIAHILYHLHHGHRSLSDPLISDLKTRSLLLEDQIQQDVLMFAEQVQFQYGYDRNHRVTPDIQAAADQLLKDLGF